MRRVVTALVAAALLASTAAIAQFRPGRAPGTRPGLTFLAGIVVPVPFTEDFNRSDQDLVPNANWTNAVGSNGDWVIETNQVRKNTNADTVALAPTTSSDNHYVQALFITSTEAGTISGLVLDYQDASNWTYLAWLPPNNSFSVIKVVGGTSTATSIGGSAPTNVVYRAEMVGGTITIKQNGTTVGSTTRELVTQRVGLGGRGPGYAPVFDNFASGAL